MENWASHRKPGTCDHHSPINQFLRKAPVKNEPLLSHLFASYPTWLFKPRLAPLSHVTTSANTRPRPIGQQGTGAQTSSHFLAV